MFTSRIPRWSGVASFSSTMPTKAPAASRTIRPRPVGSLVTAVPSRQAACSSAKRWSRPVTLSGRSIGESPQTITTGRRVAGDP